MSTSQTYPSGWYPDPSDARQFAYWDGTAWTQHRQPAPPPGYGSPQQMAVVQAPAALAPKSQGVAVFLSFLWPGLGHLYVGEVGAGLAFGFANLFLAFLTVFLIFPALFAFGLWIVGMVTAANAAGSFNERAVSAA